MVSKRSFEVLKVSDLGEGFYHILSFECNPLLVQLLIVPLDPRKLPIRFMLEGGSDMT